MLMRVKQKANSGHLLQNEENRAVGWKRGRKLDFLFFRERERAPYL